jgi:hypothetical protein
VAAGNNKVAGERTMTSAKDLAKSPLDKAITAVAKLEDQYKRARERVRKLETELHAARKDVKRERVKALIGRPVKHGTWLHSSDRFAWLNNEVGTLQKVNQKYGVVDFGARGLMNIPFADIQSAEDPRTTITMDAMRDKAVCDQWCASTPSKEAK